MTEIKISKKNIYSALVNLADNGILAFNDADGNAVEVGYEDLKKFAANEIALLERRADKARENAEKKKNEDPLIEAVMDAVSDEFETATDIALRVECPDVPEITAAKVIYRLNALVKAGKVEKTDMKIDKRTVKGFKRVV